jgi:hypothetical protein
MHIEQVEFNTIITFLGMLCATVQGVTGYFAAYYRKRAVLLRTNSALSATHRAFGNFATTLYFLGLFAGINGLIGALTRNEPPLELQSASFNIHTWGSFPVFFVIMYKLYLSYFNKKKLYGKQKWMGIAMFTAWAYTWITAAISYYLRTLPSNPQHPAPVFLLPYELLWLQLILPFVLGGAIGALAVRRAMILEKKDEERKKRRLH